MSERSTAVITASLQYTFPISLIALIIASKIPHIAFFLLWPLLVIGIAFCLSLYLTNMHTRSKQKDVSYKQEDLDRFESDRRRALRAANIAPAQKIIFPRRRTSMGGISSLLIPLCKTLKMNS